MKNIVQEITDGLFINGEGVRAHRLVLELATGQHGGGLSYQAVYYQIEKLLATVATGEPLTEKKQSLGTQIAVMEDYAQMKLDQKDWHGLADAANDLRVLETKLEMLEANPER